MEQFEGLPMSKKIEKCKNKRGSSW